MSTKKQQFILGRTFLLSLIAVVLITAFSILVKIYDVAPIGPRETEVGFSTINQAVAGVLPFNSTWYKITKYALALPILVALGFAGFGLCQLIKRKKLAKVDKELFILAGFYLVVAAVFLLFEKLSINFRPVVIDGELEASFPSTHALLSLCLCGSGILMTKTFLKNPTERKLANLILAFIATFIVLGRLISGVHWFTDIIGGCLISAMLLIVLRSLLSPRQTD